MHRVTELIYALADLPPPSSASSADAGTGAGAGAGGGGRLPDVAREICIELYDLLGQPFLLALDLLDRRCVAELRPPKRLLRQDSTDIPTAQPEDVGSPHYASLHRPREDNLEPVFVACSRRPVSASLTAGKLAHGTMSAGNSSSQYTGGGSSTPLSRHFPPTGIASGTTSGVGSSQRLAAARPTSAGTAAAPRGHEKDKDKEKEIVVEAYEVRLGAWHCSCIHFTMSLYGAAPAASASVPTATAVPKAAAMHRPATAAVPPRTTGAIEAHDSGTTGDSLVQEAEVSGLSKHPTPHRVDFWGGTLSRTPLATCTIGHDDDAGDEQRKRKFHGQAYCKHLLAACLANFGGNTFAGRSEVRGAVDADFA